MPIIISERIAMTSPINEPRPDAVVVLGRGSFSAAARRQVAEFAAAIAGSDRYGFVCHAFLDQGEPSLPHALTSCVAAGARRALVLPCFLPADESLRIWIAKVARRWQADASAPSLAVVLGAGLADEALLQPALLAAAQAAESGVDVQAVPPENWEQDPSGWDTLPAHRRHVLLCRGPRCTALGADACYGRLRESLSEHGLRSGAQRVLAAQTGCLYPCNRGPLLVVYPEAVWYGHLTPEAIERIVAGHLAEGNIIEDLRIFPGKGPE
jgi:(2Fe-2S) ferredoxin